MKISAWYGMANGLIRVWIGVHVDVAVAAMATLLLLPPMLVVVVGGSAESGHSVKQTCNSKL